MSRRRRRLLGVKWYAVKPTTQKAFLLQRIQQAIDEGGCCLFYTEGWLTAYRAQRKDRRPFLRRFRPIQPSEPTDTEGESGNE